MTASIEHFQTLWYGGPSGGACVGGIFSEKASYGGGPGIGHPNYATTAGVDDLYLAAAGLHCKNGQHTTVALLDVQSTLTANKGVWLGTPDELYGLLEARPDLILAQVADSAPFHRRVKGIRAGTKVVVVTGAEAVLDGRVPPPSQAMVLRMEQLCPATQAVGSTAPVLLAAARRLSARVIAAKATLTSAALASSRGLSAPDASRLRR